MKIKDIIDFCKTLDVTDDPQEKIKEYHDQSFNYKAPSDNTTASGFTDKVRTSILTQFSNLSFGTFDTDGTYSDSISASLLIDKAKTSGSSNAEAHFKQAGLKQDEKVLAQGMNQYLKNILESINEVSIYLITKDTSLANNPDRFIKYLFICEHYDAIISECGHDEQVIKQLDALREHPTIKFIEARMNIIANPLYAKYYNDGAIYNASDDYFEASKNDPEEAKYLPELLENLKTVRDLADQKRAEAERTEPSFKALRLLEETLEADGYTKYQTNHMTFYDINGKKIGGFYRLANQLLSGQTMPYFFAALPGGPLRKYDNNISWKLTPDSAQRYGSIKPVSGDPYENLFRSGTAKLSASAKAAHISSGSSQYAEMEKLFNEYNALISKKGFDQLRAAELIEKLSQAADTYLAFKESQRGNDNGMIRGKNSREQRRIDFASSVREFAAGKLEYTNNIRTNILLNTQYITLEDPTAELQKNGLPPNAASADNMDKRNQVVGDFLSDAVCKQLEPFFKAAADNNIDPLNYIIIDGMSAAARVRTHLNSLNKPVNLSNAAGNAERKTYPKDGLRIAGEIIACALLAKRPVTIHAATGSLQHLNESITIKADPKGFTIKSSDPTPAPDYFMNKFTEQGFDQTMYFDGEMTASKNEDILRSMNMFKENEARSAFKLTAAKKDYINDWVTAHNKDDKYLESKHAFSLSRTASASVPRAIAIGRGMSIEDVMTNGVKLNEKKAIGNSFMDRCDDIFVKEKGLQKNDPDALSNFEKYKSDSLKEISGDIYNGYVQLLNYVDTNIVKTGLGNLESMFNSKNAMLLEAHQTLFDLSQEVRNIQPHFNNLALENDTDAKTAREAGDKLIVNRASPINDYISAAKLAFEGTSHMLAGNVIPHDTSKWLRNTLSFAAFSKTLNERLKNNPGASLSQLFEDPREAFVMQSSFDDDSLDAYIMLKPPAEMNKLFAKLALDGKLADYVISKPDGTLSFDVNKFARYANNTLEAENKAAAANKTAMKKHNAAEKENPNHIERANIAAEPQKGGINL